MSNLQRYNEGLIRLNVWVRRLFTLNAGSEELYKAVCEGACVVAAAETALLQLSENGAVLRQFCCGNDGNRITECDDLPDLRKIGSLNGPASGKPIRLEPSRAPEEAELLARLKAKSAIVMALEGGDSGGYSLAVFRHVSFDRIEEQLLQQYAHSAQVLLMNADLQDELKRRAAELEHEVQERKAAEKLLERKDAILEAVAYSAEKLLQDNNWEENTTDMLARLGRATQVSRVTIFRNGVGENGELQTSLFWQWNSAGQTSEESRIQELSGAFDLRRWEKILRRGESVHGITATLPENERRVLKELDIGSFVLVPVFTGRGLWGGIALQDSATERKWSLSEMDALRAAAGIIGVAIQRTQVEQALTQSEKKFRTLVESSPDWVWVMDEKGVFTYVCPRVTDFLGYPPEEMVGKSWFDFMTKEEAQRMGDMLGGVSWEGGSFAGVEHALLHRDGQKVIFEANGAPLLDDNNQTIGYYGINRDITRRKQAEAALHRHLHFFQLVIDTIPFPMFYKDVGGAYVGCNRAFEECFGVDRREILGKKLDHLDSERSGACREMEMTLRQVPEEVTATEFCLSYADGSIHDIIFNKTFLTDIDGTPAGTVGVIIDFTKQRRAEEAARLMAYYDPLTGLPNRHFFKEILAKAQGQAHRHKTLLAVLFLDLDRFKVINDTLGHAVGDQLLQAVAQRLKECCRKDIDTVARRGGDEFLVLLTELQEVEDALRVAHKIMDRLTKPVVISGHEIFISTSIGISLYPYDGHDMETLVQKADMAMYRAKEQGKNTYQLYTEVMNVRAFERLALENSLRKALDRQEMELFYQPKVDIASGRIGSYEALVRWHHPEMGFVGPGDFIPLAEETGLIVPLGEWVLRHACNQNKLWQRQGYAPMRVAVNLSPRQFLQPDLVDMILHVLKETDLDASWLELEVTENIMIQDVGQTKETLRRLHDLGITISIDDFGTGYSSLSYLKKFPIHTLKIDRSFVSDITHNADDAAIATAVITMAHSLKLGVIAEGVETREQLELLRSLQCENMQGNYFSKPVPARDFIRFMEGGGWPERHS